MAALTCGARPIRSASAPTKTPTSCPPSRAGLSAACPPALSHQPLLTGTAGATPIRWRRCAFSTLQSRAPHPTYIELIARKPRQPRLHTLATKNPEKLLLHRAFASILKSGESRKRTSVCRLPINTGACRIHRPTSHRLAARRLRQTPDHARSCVLGDSRIRTCRRPVKRVVRAAARKRQTSSRGSVPT